MFLDADAPSHRAELRLGATVFSNVSIALGARLSGIPIS